MPQPGHRPSRDAHAHLVRSSHSFPANGWRRCVIIGYTGGCISGSTTSNRITFSGLINDLVDTGEDRRRDGKVERSRGIEIDD